MHDLGIQAVALEKFHHRRGDLLSLFGVIAVGHFGAHSGPCPRGKGQLNGEQGEVVVRAEHLFVGGQVGEHLFGVGAAIHREQDLHWGSPSQMGWRRVYGLSAPAETRATGSGLTVMSALISGKPIYFTIFGQFQFFVPDFIFTEI